MIRAATIATNVFLAACMAMTTMLCGCMREMTVPEGYAWLRDPEHGMSDTMVIRNYVIRCTMMPAAFRRARLAMRNATDSTKPHGADAVVLTLEITRRDGRPMNEMQDILFDDMTSVGAYTEKLAGLSFRLHEDMTLETDKGHSYSGADTFMEQTTGLGERRIITITMAASEHDIAASDEARLVWTDRYFGSGRVQFQFRPRTLRNLPELRI
ncbi:MAG: hypothetical protein J0I17_13430 ['Candidatus Kapabacteria' thiocyanatum]|uniref:Uncharacterized protein n=1 Tax=Candidatus Kapaibacterium thiocyanatum TaxID=1895771 RepID=A0A1M3KZH9_9BACT|nr:hypothetical protein ['Candidatus Kapabacteria' thiocyanatum]OJX57984.1 MAG: hypothetical protein BGO89_06180 ['Candidatus Kapabacteria' thiocyanatum]